MCDAVGRGGRVKPSTGNGDNARHVSKATVGEQSGAIRMLLQLLSLAATDPEQCGNLAADTVEVMIGPIAAAYLRLGHPPQQARAGATLPVSGLRGLCQDRLVPMTSPVPTRPLADSSRTQSPRPTDARRACPVCRRTTDGASQIRVVPCLQCEASRVSPE